MYSKIIGLLNVVEGNIDPNDTYSMAVVRQMDVSAREDWHYLLGKVKWIKQEEELRRKHGLISLSELDEIMKELHTHLDEDLPEFYCRKPCPKKEEKK